MIFKRAIGWGGNPPGWHSRDYLPHLNTPQIIQSITFRLWDSLPRKALDQIELALLKHPEDQRESGRSIRLERLLDAGHGSCLLSDARAATIVVEALRYFDGSRYQLQAWIVMPNHVHVLITLLHECVLTTIVKSWKSYTALQINRAFGRSGRLWMPDYYDRYIRDVQHFEAVVQYIENNAVKAGLVATPTDWEFSSARKPLHNS